MDKLLENYNFIYEVISMIQIDDDYDMDDPQNRKKNQIFYHKKNI